MSITDCEHISEHLHMKANQRIRVESFLFSARLVECQSQLVRSIGFSHNLCLDEAFFPPLLLRITCRRFFCFDSLQSFGRSLSYIGMQMVQGNIFKQRHSQFHALRISGSQLQ